MMNRLSSPATIVRTTRPKYRQRKVKKIPIKINGNPSLAKGNLLLILVLSKLDGIIGGS